MDFYDGVMSHCDVCEFFFFFLDILTNEDKCDKTGIPNCVCDRSKLYCGPDHRTCQKWPGKATDIKEDQELAQNCKS